MIRSGKLDRQITIERMTETVSASGAVSKAWTPLVSVRAELVQQSADEYLAAFGEAQQGNLIFRIRYVADLKTSDRVVYDAATYDLDQITELGRKRGLELRMKGGAT